MLDVIYNIISIMKVTSFWTIHSVTHDTISFVGQLLLELFLLPAMEKDNISSP